MRKLIAALALSVSALLIAIPNATPVHAGSYTCGVFKDTSTHPDNAFGSCRTYGVVIYQHRIVITCTSGNPVNQVTRYGNWVRSNNQGQSASSKAYCSSSYPYLLGAYFQTKAG